MAIRTTQEPDIYLTYYATFKALPASERDELAARYRSHSPARKAAIRAGAKEPSNAT